MEFNGVDDGLQFDIHPLAGASTFTWEAVFRPDGGNAEQRWFHLEENPADGADTDNRMPFEIRVIDGRWCLDAFNKSGPTRRRCSIASTCTIWATGITWRRFTMAGVSQLHRRRSRRRGGNSLGGAGRGTHVSGSSH